MAKISISSLSIENLGPFRERQTLDLGVSGDRPVILVKALNGSGKTTLLTALQIGLYGYKAISGGRRTDYDQLLLGLHRKDASGNAVVEVGVIVEIGGLPRQLVVRREWSRESDSLREVLTVLEGTGKHDEFSHTWEDFIESILPVELIQLFLFDGEKIEALANPERLPDLLKRATEVFLGIGGIESLGNDLKAFERRTALKNKNISAEFEAARDNLMNWEVQARKLEDKVLLLTQQQASSRNALDQMQTSLNKYSVEAQRQGIAAYEEAAKIRSDVVISKQHTEAVRASLAEAMSDPVLPLAWLSGLWGQYCEAWEQDQHARHAKLLSKEFKKRDQRIVSALDGLVPKAAINAVRNALDEDLSSYGTVRRAAGVALQDASPQDVEKHLHSIKSRLKTELRSLQQAQSGLDRAEQHIGQIPAEEQVAEILRNLQERTKAVSVAEERLAELTRQLEEAQGQFNHVQTRLNAAQERLGTEFRDHSLEAKSLEASGRAKRALVVFKDRLLASKAEWLSDVITTEFRNLLRKRNLIAKVIVDPVTYRVSIEDGKHHELPMERLSAGERQLLAISVLSALIKERKGRFPVVVDTPLARLDQQHRSTLIKRFFATVSHQVVVLSTDQEVDGQAYETLKPYTNAEYSLNFDDVAGHTTIQTREAV
ncbi:MAG: DNA sulfur modification protein DndD [Sideroxyarcus sp.]|nr:DNA sulfur modification protein DndD [Sideroxyarcus sp.]